MDEYRQDKRASVSRNQYGVLPPRNPRGNLEMTANHDRAGQVVVVDVGNSSLRLGIFASLEAMPAPLPNERLQLSASDLAFDRLDTWLPSDVRHCYVARKDNKTIAENPDLLIDEKEYRALATNVLTPLVIAFEEADEQGPA